MGLLHVYLLKIWEKSADFWKSYNALYIEKMMLP